MGKDADVRPDDNLDQVVGDVAASVVEEDNDTLQTNDADDAGDTSKCEYRAQDDFLFGLEGQVPHDWDG